MKLFPKNWIAHSPRPLLHGLGLTFAGATVGVAALAHRGTEARLAAMQGEQRQAVLLIEQEPALRAAYDDSRRQIARIRSELAAARASYPAKVDETEVLAWLAELCERTGVEFYDYHPGSIVALPTHKEMEIRLNCGGAYPEVCRFLFGLEDFPYGYRVTQLNVTAPAAPGEDCSFDLQLRISFALQSPPKA